jgi:Ni/Fe-hydrogenase subunit HybB-like protein
MRLLVGALVLLSLAGVFSLAVMWTQPLWHWGYIAATASFLLSAGGTAPVLSMASRVGRGYWGVRLRRVADVLGLTSVVSAPLFIVALAHLPEWQGRDSIWFDWPGAPLLWDSVAVLGLTGTSVALVWVVTWPERRGLQWSGTPTQWRVLTRGTIALGAFYSMLVVFIHLLVSSDLGLSLVAGWHSAVIAPYHAVSGFEAGVALVVLGLAAVRQLDTRVSRSCAKLLLSLGLLWFYFVWCELLTDWYGRTPDEQSVLALFMFGPGGGLFLVSTLCEFAVPLCVLVWNGARGSPKAVGYVAAVVVLGNLTDRLRLYVGAWSVATPAPTEHLPEALPPLPLPGAIDLLACAGMLALAALVVVLVLQRLKAIPDWEVKAVERLTPERQVLRTRTVIVARPG